MHVTLLWRGSCDFTNKGEQEFLLSSLEALHVVFQEYASSDAAGLLKMHQKNPCLKQDIG